MTKPSSSIKAMLLEDGLPECFIKTAEERAAIWKARPPVKPVWSMSKMRDDEEVAVASEETQKDLVDKKKLPPKKVVSQVADRAQASSSVQKLVSEYNSLADKANA